MFKDQLYCFLNLRTNPSSGFSVSEIRFSDFWPRIRIPRALKLIFGYIYFFDISTFSERKLRLKLSDFSVERRRDGNLFAAHLSRATFAALRGRPVFHSITIFYQQWEQTNSGKWFSHKGLKNILRLKKFRKDYMNRDFRPSENWEFFSKKP